MSRMPRSISCTLAMLLALGACKNNKTDTKPTEATDNDPVSVRVIAFNDLHGNIEQPSSGLRLGDKKVPAGGLDVMATHLETLRKDHPNTAFVCAGDLIGASPLVSALFHDEPTIEAMNKLGLDVLAVGNHEFDDGVDEIVRLQEGGCNPEVGCQGKDAFAGAEFPFLAANVVVDKTEKTLFPATLIKNYDGVKVGFIGLTLEGTDKAVSPEAIEGITFLDEAETINRYTKRLQDQGVQAIVVVMHEGGWQGQDDGDINGCNDLQGPIVEINKQVDPAVDVIVAGHTHRYFNCEIEGRLLTSAKDYGRMLTSIDLTIDPSTGEVLTKKATNVIMSRDDVEVNAEMAEHIARYRELVGPLASKQLGTLTADISRSMDDAGNSAVGQLVADAQLAATRENDAGGAHFALMNPGGVRNDLTFAPKENEPEGVITYEELHSVQPFGNTLTVIELTGAQIETILESQWQSNGKRRILQPSANFTYTWREAESDRIATQDILLDGNALVPDQLYRVTVNSFLATGGDGFSTLTEGKVIAGGPVDLDVFAEFVQRNSPLKAPAP